MHTWKRTFCFWYTFIFNVLYSIFIDFKLCFGTFFAECTWIQSRMFTFTWMEVYSIYITKYKYIYILGTLSPQCGSPQFVYGSKYIVYAGAIIVSLQLYHISTSFKFELMRNCKIRIPEFQRNERVWEAWHFDIRKLKVGCSGGPWRPLVLLSKSLFAFSNFRNLNVYFTN